LSDDDSVRIASLSDSENEKHAFTAHDAATQPTGTRSEKSYLRLYEKTTDETQQPTTSAEIPVLTLVPTPEKKSRKKSDLTEC